MSILSMSVSIPCIACGEMTTVGNIVGSVQVRSDSILIENNPQTLILCLPYFHEFKASIWQRNKNYIPRKAPPPQNKPNRHAKNKQTINLQFKIMMFHFSLCVLLQDLCYYLVNDIPPRKQNIFRVKKKKLNLKLKVQVKQYIFSHVELQIYV